MPENGIIANIAQKFGLKPKAPASEQRAHVGDVRPLSDALRPQSKLEKKVPPTETKILSTDGGTSLRLRADTENPIQITLGSDPNTTNLEAIANMKTFGLHARKEGGSTRYYLTDERRPDTTFDIPNNGQPYPVGRVNRDLFPNHGEYHWVSREHLSLTPRGDVIDISHQSQTNPTYIIAPQADIV